VRVDYGIDKAAGSPLLHHHNQYLESGQDVEVRNKVIHLVGNPVVGIIRSKTLVIDPITRVPAPCH